MYTVIGSRGMDISFRQAHECEADALEHLLEIAVTRANNGHTVTLGEPVGARPRLLVDAGTDRFESITIE